MKRWMFVLLFLLSGCGIAFPTKENSYQFYYINDLSSTGEVLTGVTRYLPEAQDQVSPLTLMQAHLSYGWEHDVKTPFPQGLVVMAAEEQLPGIVDLYFSEVYSDLVGMHLTVANYAVVKTMNQLPSVVGVRIYVHGVDYSEEAPPILRENDMLLVPLVQEP